jgi:prepilin-type N-terminal cleavage/methylation domain-containing protein
MAGRHEGRRSRGFTLVEALVTAALVAVALVAVLGAVGATQKAAGRAHTADLLQRLAAEKLSDLQVTGDPTVEGRAGDFSDRGYGAITWTQDLEPTETERVYRLSVTAARGGQSQAVTTLIFLRPSSGAGGGSLR